VRGGECEGREDKGLLGVVLSAVGKHCDREYKYSSILCTFATHPHSNHA
jgi:hypothetical protein